MNQHRDTLQWIAIGTVLFGMSACNGNPASNPSTSNNSSTSSVSPDQSPSIASFGPAPGAPTSEPNPTPTTSNPGPVATPSPSSTSTPTPTPTATATPTPSSTPTPTPTPTPAPTNVGVSCHSDDPNSYCLGVKYVVYTNSKGTPVATQQEAISNIAAINNVWKTCKIAFEISKYAPEDPTKSQLTYNTANMSELDDIRDTYEDNDTLLVVTTGKWNRSGSLGSTGANAWTSMPGSNVYGAILESEVATYPNIIAHELGHYLNLDHYGNAANLMNPTIYTTSTQLTSAQCSEAKSAISTYWKKMMR